MLFKRKRKFAMSVVVLRKFLSCLYRCIMRIYSLCCAIIRSADDFLHRYNIFIHRAQQRIWNHNSDFIIINALMGILIENFHLSITTILYLYRYCFHSFYFFKFRRHLVLLLSSNIIIIQNRILLHRAAMPTEENSRINRFPLMWFGIFQLLFYIICTTKCPITLESSVTWVLLSNTLVQRPIILCYTYIYNNRYNNAVIIKNVYFGIPIDSNIVSI